MKLLCVPPDRVAEFWPAAFPYVKSALDRVGLMTVEDIDPHSLLWLAVDETVIGAGLTSLLADRHGRFCEIVAWGCDDQKRCAHLLAELENYAKDEGCGRIRMVGRKGWRRLEGYTEKAVIMEKAL